MQTLPILSNGHCHSNIFSVDRENTGAPSNTGEHPRNSLVCHCTRKKRKLNHKNLKNGLKLSKYLMTVSPSKNKNKNDVLKVM
jgi:hypothetical protein